MGLVCASYSAMSKELSSKQHENKAPALELFVANFKLPYILESNPHTFYSFRGLKNQMGIRIACGLESCAD